MAWACVSGARWAAPGRARTTVRFSPLTSRGPMSSASIKAVARRGGRAVGLLALLLSVSPPVRLSAQGLLSQFSYDNLKPSALQLDVGPLGGNNIRGAFTGGVRLDYGFIAPHVRVLLGVSYFKADFGSAARARFEQRLKSVVVDPSGDDTIKLGGITWSDVTGDVDLQYVLPQGHAVTAYMGIGLGAHFRHGSGAAINGTFVQDALNEITAGLNGTVGAEFGAKRWRFTLEARGGRACAVRAPARAHRGGRRAGAAGEREIRQAGHGGHEPPVPLGRAGGAGVPGGRRHRRAAGDPGRLVHVPTEPPGHRLAAAAPGGGGRRVSRPRAPAARPRPVARGLARRQARRR